MKCLCNVVQDLNQFLVNSIEVSHHQSYMYVARTFRISTVRIGYWFNNFVENPKSKTIECACRIYIKDTVWRLVFVNCLVSTWKNANVCFNGQWNSNQITNLMLWIWMRKTASWAQNVSSRLSYDVRSKRYLLNSYLAYNSSPRL